MTKYITRMLLAAALLMLVSTAARAAGPPPQPGTEKTRFEYAMGLYNQGAYENAAAELKALLVAYPKGEYADDAYYWLGKIFSASGKYEEALAEFKAGLSSAAAGDKAPELQYEVAMYYAQPDNPARDMTQAMAEFLKIPFFYPQSPLVPEALYRAALCQAKVGGYEKAEDELKSFAAKYPDSEFAAPALYRLGTVYMMDGKPDEALASFQAVRDRYPAGLYSTRALAAVELVMRTREKRLGFLYSSGTKGQGPGQFVKPSGVAVDPEGALLVADTGNARLAKFVTSVSGLAPVTPAFIRPSPEKAQALQRPSGVCVTDKGVVYVSDQYAHRVQAYGADGRLISSVGRKGTGPGELDGPAGLAVDESGTLYVADRGNRRVEVYDRDGRFVRSLGSAGVSEENLLKGPQGVAVDLEGRVLVTDAASDRVLMYGPDGKLLTVLTNASAGRALLDGPDGICVDGVGNVYVVNRGAPSLVILDRELRPVMEYGGEGGKAFDTPSGVAVSEAGLVFVSDYGKNSVLVLR